MATGFESTLKSTGRTDAVIVMRGGSETELNSALDTDSSELIKQGAGIRGGADGKPLASAEMMVIAELIRKDDVKNGANITVREVEPAAFALRPQLKIVAGRSFTTGLRELIVGRGVLRQFQGAELGKVVRMRGSDWTVVGVFESGDAHDSELWTDINVARTTEIATLRAIGFGGLPVLISVMLEALLLALIGGLLGALIAYVLFNGLSVSTLGENFTQVVFNFKVTPELVERGLIIAVVIGMIGGLLPAIRAARQPVTTSLREL